MQHQEFTLYHCPYCGEKCLDQCISCNTYKCSMRNCTTPITRENKLCVVHGGDKSDYICVGVRRCNVCRTGFLRIGKDKCCNKCNAKICKWCNICVPRKKKEDMGIGENDNDIYCEKHQPQIVKCKVCEREFNHFHKNFSDWKCIECSCDVIEYSSDN